MGKFNAQDLANTLWAFARVKHSDEALFAALAREAEHAVIRAPKSTKSQEKTPGVDTEKKRKIRKTTLFFGFSWFS